MGQAWDKEQMFPFPEDISGLPSFSYVYDSHVYGSVGPVLNKIEL